MNTAFDILESYPMYERYADYCDELDNFSAARLRQANNDKLQVIYRTGVGVDVHPYCNDVKDCMIGCVKWLDSKGIEGHSDGDVVAHAICDSVLSACRLGDLGILFGIDEPDMQDATGYFMLKKTISVAMENSWHIENVAVQFLGKTPHVLPRHFEVALGLSKIMNAPVSFSATTTDNLGFIGRGDGVCAISTTQVSKIL